MTLLQYGELLLENHWTPDAADVDGRTHDVPKPRIIIEEERDKDHVPEAGLIVVRDGGPVERQAVEIEDNAVQVDMTVEFDCRVQTRREDLLGWRDENDNTGESYGGLTGEVTRILEARRKGHKEFDRIPNPRIDDISGQLAPGNWRANVTASPEVIASSINP